MIRLQKYIAECGIASRRGAEEIIKAGSITVNGKVVTEMGVTIDEEKDSVKLKGKLIKPTKTKLYIMLNKPEGYICTVKDQFKRPTVLDLIPRIKEKLVPVGRLDYATSGMLLLSNDGDFVYKLTHPKHKVAKTYEAKVKGIPTEEAINKLKSGVIVDGKKTGKCQARIKKIYDKNCLLEITINEGRNRQVRKMCDAIGHNVLGLKRISIGKLVLGLLLEGEYRNLRPEEVKRVLGE